MHFHWCIHSLGLFSAILKGIHHLFSFLLSSVAEILSVPTCMSPSLCLCVALTSGSQNHHTFGMKDFLGSASATCLCLASPRPSLPWAAMGSKNDLGSLLDVLGEQWKAAVVLEGVEAELCVHGQGVCQLMLPSQLRRVRVWERHIWKSDQEIGPELACHNVLKLVVQEVLGTLKILISQRKKSHWGSFLCR